MEDVGNNNDHELQLSQDRIIVSNGGNCSNNSTRSTSGNSAETNGPPNIELIATRKSSLKKTTSIVDGQDQDQENQLKTDRRRKVSWPDAHGKDIAHVREFEPSVSDDGELEGVKNSCVCAIQ